MICAYDESAQAWVAAGQGVLRPIVVEGGSRTEAWQAFWQAVILQQAEEYAFCAAMERPIVEAQEGVGEDLG